MSAVLRVRHAAGALQAAMELGHTTAEELAQALEDCQLLQSPETAAARASLRPVTVRPVTVPVHTIDPDVEEDSPAADLALRLRTSQPDVLGTVVRSATEVQVTVRPQSPDCLRWWLGRFEADPQTGTYLGGTYTVRGRRDGVTVYLVITGDAVTAWSGAVHRAS
ncbi:hypothetical protein AW27_026505 [Streptomyces sp. PCS3-D2]|uniref:hypothetical protein n=1 Tax=Streptomyces sp. PCS3-D2 TaxID=1460244 RepID=UPI0004486052|nr:hypothetical protein [Streptomyces sp. PCS3-D2]WKV74254.1 hypothetical protein AW27_023720 [Streptomyces sp. PCS3-D2]WKV74760.1 hypothetical protein AW27_026505 [Streptomyces sp. PCS3-D2]